MFEIKIQGLADLQKTLNELPVNIEKNVMRGALRAGGEVIAEDARTRIHDAPPGMTTVKLGGRIGELRRSIKVTLRRRGKTGWINAKVSAGNKVAWYAHMVEFGTARHWIKPKNRKSLFFAGLARELIDHPGARPHPFMRPALDSKAEAAMVAMADYIRIRLPKELKKAGK